MTRDKALIYVEDALAALAKCKTDHALVKWDDQWTNNQTYLGLDSDLIVKLENAYDKRVRWITGASGG